MRLCDCLPTRDFIEFQLRRIQEIMAAENWFCEQPACRAAVIQEYRVWLELRKDFHEKWRIYTEE